MNVQENKKRRLSEPEASTLIDYAAADEIDSLPFAELTDLSSDDSDMDMDLSDDEKAEPASRFGFADTILIFDWDDTILPSTWIQQQGLRLDDQSWPNREQRRQLRVLARRGAQTLRAAKALGGVVLVTNAERGWIELSCRKFLPTLWPSLESLKILSARSVYEKPGVTSPSEWKTLAFAQEIKRYYKDLPIDRRKNIMSFGDSAHERRALFQVVKHISNCCTKSFKLEAAPNVQQLQKQLELIRACLVHFVCHDGNLDLCVRCAT